MFSDELKEGTRYAHSGLEKKLVSRIKNIHHLDDYVKLLRLMYGYYKPLQNKLEPYIPAGDVGEPFTVRNVEYIIDDIQHLVPGGDEHIPVCKSLPEVSSQASSLGALYVTEGSTLGGQIITKMISTRLKIPMEKGFSFFNSYGDETQARWATFKNVLDRPRNAHERSEMMRTAIDTFSSFKDWIEEHERN